MQHIAIRDSQALSASNPQPQAQLDLKAAIRAWLMYTSSNSQHTFKSYNKELLRWLLYCQHARCNFLEATVVDVNNYLQILQSPPDYWLKPGTGQPIYKTQVLIHPLSLRSVDYAQTVLSGLYEYLKKAGLITHNPVALSAKINVPTSLNDSKALSYDAWLFLSQWLKHQSISSPKRGKAIRDRWLMHLLYYSAMRKSSVLTCQMNSFSIKQRGPDRIWMLKFGTKGNKNHEVIAIAPLLAELGFYRAALGLPALPLPDEEYPLVAAVLQGKMPLTLQSNAISSRGISYVIEESLKLAAQDCEDHYIAQELAAATPHTFRHTCATHQLTMGVDVVATKNHLGHAQINTTMLYLKNTQQHDMEQLKKFEQKCLEQDTQ